MRHNVNVIWFKLNAWKTPARLTNTKLIPIDVPLTRDMSANNILSVPLVFSLINNILSRESIDIVVMSNILPGLVASHLACSAGVPCVFDYHDHLPDSASLYYRNGIVKKAVRYAVSRIVSASLKNCSLVVCSSASLARSVNRLYQIPPSFIRVVPNGFDPAVFRPLGGRDFLVRRLGLEELANHFLVVYAGSIEPRLDFGTLLEAIRDLYKDGNKIKLIIVGKSVSSNLERDLRECFGQLPYVHFAGYLPNPTAVSYYMNIADACVAPYKLMLTNFGVTLKVLEYLALAKPTFVTAVPDIVEQLGACVIVYRSKADLYEKLKAMIHNKSIYRAIAQQGRLQVRNFTWDAVAQRYEKLLQELVDRNVA